MEKHVITTMHSMIHMIKQIILVALLYVVVAATAVAQNVSLGDPTEEEMAAKEEYVMRQGREFQEQHGMSYREWKSGEWMEDRLFRNKKPLNFNIPIPDYSPRPQRQGGMIFDNSPMPTRASSGQYEQQQKLTHDRNAQNQTHNLKLGNANYNANVETMRRNAEERKRRNEAENRADRERGRREYYRRMGGFHAANAARDRWMATEGIRHLQEDVHAMDMASIPPAKREDKLDLMSGSDMANLLKGKEEGLTVEVVVVERDNERQNKTGVALGQQSDGDGTGVIDLYDDGGYDETSMDLWEYSTTSSEAYITLPAKLATTNEYNKTLILKKSQLDVEDFYLTTLPGMGCVALLGDSLVLLDSENLDLLEWGKGLDVTEVVTCGKRTFAKQHNKIIEITLDSATQVAAFDSENFSIYSETDTTLIVNATTLDMTVVMRFNIERMTYDEILRITSPIKKVCANGIVVLSLSEDKIIDIDPLPTLFYQSKEAINDIAMSPDGLLVATDKQVALLKSEEDIVLFSKEGAKRLWSDGFDIYLLDNKGDLYRYSKNNNQL